MDATSRRQLTTRAAEPAKPVADAAGSTGAAEQSRGDPPVVAAHAAAAILADATVETETKDDGRYVIYYSWPDDV